VSSEVMQTIAEKRRVDSKGRLRNGLIAGGPKDQRWISNAVSRQLVHRWRSEEDSVLVGYRTALADNPKLNVRDWTGRNPIRIVIDKNLSLPSTLHLFDKSQKTIVFNLEKDTEHDNLSFVKLNGTDFLSQLLNQLLSRGVQSVIVEGGQATLNSFLQSGFWDEARVIESSSTFLDGLEAPRFEGKLLSTTFLAGDKLHLFQNLKVKPVVLK